MKNFEKSFLSPDARLYDALQIIDGGAMKMALVVDANKKLLGTLSDGDIRRALLKGASLAELAKNFYCRSPSTCRHDDSREMLLQLALEKKIYHFPLLDDVGRVVGVVEIDELVRPETHRNKIVLMVGGLGSRLSPLTNTTPKPMLNVGNKPILETIIQNFIKCGYRNFILCVNYKSNVIMDYFGDGQKIGANIEYVVESKRLGTAGALWLIREKLEEPFFVMNGGILTSVDFSDMQNYHSSHNAMATMAVRDYTHQVPYGVVELHGEKICSIKEKPIHKFFISAGIYFLEPQALEFVAEDEFFDMPTLFERIILNSHSAISFPIREYWLDIGKMADFERANSDFSEVFQG